MANSKFLNISTDVTLGGNSSSDSLLSSQKAIKEYADTKLKNLATGSGSLTLLGTPTTNNINDINIGVNSSISGTDTWASIAIGCNCHTTKAYAIQLGSGTNNEARTFCVGLSADNNYKLLDSNGTIPTDRFTTTPINSGTYVPTIEVNSGTVTRSWTTPLPAYTAGTNIAISGSTISSTAAQVVIRRYS